jgi:hypothetical protein
MTLTGFDWSEMARGWRLILLGGLTLSIEGLRWPAHRVDRQECHHSEMD